MHLDFMKNDQPAVIFGGAFKGHARNPYWKKVTPEECWGKLSGSFWDGLIRLGVWNLPEISPKKQDLLMG